MKVLLTAAILCCCLMQSSGIAQAGLTDWWPAKSTSSKSSPKSSKAKKSSAKKPFMGSTSAKGSSGFKMPNVVGSISTNTKKAYSNTKAMLTPGKKKPQPKKLTGSKSKSTRAKKESEESTSIFGSLFAEKEPEPPNSVKEWMSLPRLDP